MANEAETCPGCGDPLPEPVLCSISHTIDPGSKLCSDCGQKETLEPGWAEGRRVGWVRHKRALDSVGVVERVVRQKGADDGCL